MRKLITLLAAVGLLMTTTGASSAATTHENAPVSVRSAAVAEQAPTRVMSREFKAATSAKARDLRGEEPSLYRGKYFHASQEKDRLCIAEREGTFTYMLGGKKRNGYFGTYQMTAELMSGAAWMMAKESRATKDGLLKKALRLVHAPGNKWSRYWQDRAFYTVWNWEYLGSGSKHWRGGRWHC